MNKAIEELIDEAYIYGCNHGQGKKVEPISKWYNKLLAKYSVTYRNQHDSSPNESDEESINWNNMHSEIECIVAEKIESRNTNHDLNSKIATEILDLVKTYHKCDSSQVQNQVEQIVEEPIKEEIKAGSRVVHKDLGGGTVLEYKQEYDMYSVKFDDNPPENYNWGNNPCSVYIEDVVLEDPISNRIEMGSKVRHLKFGIGYVISKDIECGYSVVLFIKHPSEKETGVNNPLEVCDANLRLL